MSVSTTHVVSAAATNLLSAYDLHHSGADSLQSQRAEPAYQSPRQQGSPLSWPSNRRRMPNYREPSRDHRLVDRPAGQDTVEGVMVTIMFIGVYMNSAVVGLENDRTDWSVPQALSKLWHQTGGRINDRIFRYEVGGER